MNFLRVVFVFQTISLSILSNGAFIDNYVNPSVRPYCSEKQEKISFKYSFRIRKQKNINSHAVYLFTEDKIFSIYQMTTALNTKESTDYVIPEIFFTDVEVKNLDEFWNGKKPDDSFNSVFSDPEVFGKSFWLSGDHFRAVDISVDDFKVTSVDVSIPFSEGKYGFMRNEKIKAKGFENILGVDIADAGGFRPIRVYVRDVEDNGYAISFAFYNNTQVIEEFENGKHYNYTFDSAAFLVWATALAAKPKPQQYSHYFELRTRRGIFSLFDFNYNRDFLLVGTNEELFGCPPSFCQSRQFDDIIRLHNGSKLLVFHEWIWNFNKPGEPVEWEEAVLSDMCSRQHITRDKNFPKPFKFGVRHILDGSLTDDSTLYLFRNGSFLSSKDDSIISGSSSFTKYTPISQFFKGVPSQTYDAILYHKKSRTIFFIKEDMFWAFSMDDRALTSDDFPKHTESLDLPFDFLVKSTYVEEDDSGNQIKFYLFNENHYLVFNENQFKDNRFERMDTELLCTSVNFFGCPDSDFECPQLETSEEPTDEPFEEPTEQPTQDSNPEPIPESNPVPKPVPHPAGPQEPSEEESNPWFYLIIIFVIIIILLAIIGILFFVIKKKSTNSETDQNSGQNKEDIPPNSDLGFKSNSNSASVRSNVNDVNP